MRGSRGNVATAAFDVSGQIVGSSVTPPATSLGSSQPTDTSTPPPTPRPPRGKWLAWRWRIIVVLVVIMGAAVTFIMLHINSSKPAVLSTEQTNAAERFDTLNIPLSELSGLGAVFVDNSRTLSINGQLKANNGLVITPSTQPTTAVPGQIYYDQGSNQLNYYNGSQFVNLPSSQNTVTNINGVSGALTLGAGLSGNGSQLNNDGVLTIQGQAGNVSLIAGPGITIDGTTLSSTGVSSLGGQSGDITIGAGLSLTKNELRNSGVVSVSSSSVTLTVTDDGNGNITLSESGAGTGTVQSPGGTAGRIAKFTGVQTIADSLLSESGSVVTVNGDLSVTGALSLSTPLSVAQGGSGVGTLAANGVLVGNGTSPITSVVAGGTGLCLVSTAGTPNWQACPGGGVSSLDGLNGALTLANSSGSGTTVTINDASTLAKGIASFNSTNFSVSSGVVNTIQNINTTAAVTFGRLNLSSSQASNPLLIVNNTNSSATGNLLDLQLVGVSKLAVAPSGDVTGGTYNGQTISSAANFTGSLTVAGSASLSGGASVTGTLNAGTLATNTITPSSALTVGATAQSFTIQGNASSTIIATDSGNTTSLAFQTPTASVTYRLLTATAGTYDICTTVGNCAGVGGGVTTPGGTANKIAKFTGSQAIGNSIITDNGSTVTIGGTLSVNALSPSAALTVGAQAQNVTLQGASVSLTTTSGGVTNTLTFATPATSNKTITIPNANGTVAVSASGPINLDSNGNVTCPSCVTSGGGGGGVAAVDSVDTLTGALTIANSSGSAATITIDNASTSAKGIAQFNSTNFSAASGVINTIQNINATAAPTFGQLSLTSSQASAAMLVVNNTNTGASGNLLDLQLNGGSAFSVAPNGNTTIAGNLTSGAINGQTISSSASFTGTVAVAGLASLNAGATVSGAFTANGDTLFKDTTNSTTAFQIQTSSATPLFVADTTNSRLYVGNPTADSTGALLVMDTKNTSGDPTGINGSIYYNSNSNTFRCFQNSSWTNCITASTSPTLQNVYDNSTSPASITTTDAKDVVFNLADTSTDANFVVNLQCDISCSTNGRFQIQDDGTTTVSVSPSGAVLLQNSVNSASALEVTNAAGTFHTLSVNNVDGRVAIGTTTSGAGSTLLVNGSAQLTGISSANFTTPLGSSISAKFLVDAVNPGAFGQIIALGLTSTSPSSARGIMIADARSSTNNQPALSILSPNEANIFGLAWDGSNTTAKLKAADQTTNNTAGINLSVVAGTAKGTAAGGTASLLGGTGGSTGGAGGSVLVQGGSAAASNSNGGDVTLQGGNSAGSGTPGSVIVKPQTDNSAAFMIQNAAGSRLAVVNTTTSNPVINGGAEIAFGSEWASYGTGATVARTTNLAWSGQAAVSVTTTGSANSGVKQNLGAALAANDFYAVGFYAQVASGSFNDIAVVYSPDGTGGSEVACINYNTQTLAINGWTRITCIIDTPVTAGNTSAYVAIKQTAGASRIFYIDGMNLTQTSTVPSTYGAGSLALDATITSAMMLQNTENSTAAFLLEDSFGADILRVDTQNRYVQIGSPDNDGYDTMLVLDNQTDVPPEQTAVDGAMYYNSSLKSFRCQMNGAWRSCIGGTVFANISVPAAVANTTTETNFATNYTIPANDCQPGRTYKIVAQGVWTDTSTPNLIMRVKMGTTNIGSSPAAAAPTTASSNQNWRLEYQIICITTGASGTVEGQGQLILFSDSSTIVGRALTNTGTITVNTTVSQLLQMSAQWGTANASNTITMRQFIVDAGGP